MSPLRLMADGLDAEELVSLQAIVGILSGKLQRDWVCVAGTDASADLYLHAIGQRRAGVQAGLTGLVVRENEQPPAMDQLSLVAPFRVMSVLELLESAADRLALQADAATTRDVASTRAAAAPVVALDPPEANDEKTVAASLVRSLAGPSEHTLRIRILGFGTLYVCTRSRVYCMDFERGRIAEALEAKRFVLMAISPDSEEFRDVLESASPIEHLLWPVGLMLPRESVATGQRHRLRAWPDFASIPHQHVHLQACARLSGDAMDVERLAGETGMSLAQADRFLHACELCGLLEPDSGAAAPRAASARAPRAVAEVQAAGGLFDRLWRRLKRQGE